MTGYTNDPWQRDDDEELKREAWEERHARFNGCKCGNPDWPGSCPGWRSCPIWQEDEPEDAPK